MYVRSDGDRRIPKDISIPKNYSGNAFTKKEPLAEEMIESDTSVTEDPAPETEAVFKSVREERKGFLSGIAGNEDFLLLGLILLLSQDGFDDDILPIILLILFLKK